MEELLQYTSISYSSDEYFNYTTNLRIELFYMK